MSGAVYMPPSGSEKGILDSIIDIAGASLYPLSLSLLLPVFMYNIVSEKEEKLLEMMKMNGLKIINYWKVILFNIGIICILFYDVYHEYGLVFGLRKLCVITIFFY